MLLRIKKLDNRAKIPFRATDGSAGMDLYCILDEPVTMQPHTNYSFQTGIAIELPSNEYAAFVFARSGLATKHGIAPTNCVGVIDSDYRGEIKVNLINQTDVPFTINDGERIAQLIVMPVAVPEIEECSELSDTERGDGGFGSTGKK
jgi:dUTP pyrophosphatase